MGGEARGTPTNQSTLQDQRAEQFGFLFPPFPCTLSSQVISHAPSIELYSQYLKQEAPQKHCSFLLDTSVLLQSVNINLGHVVYVYLYGVCRQWTMLSRIGLMLSSCPGRADADKASLPDCCHSWVCGVLVAACCGSSCVGMTAQAASRRCSLGQCVCVWDWIPGAVGP